MNILVVEPDSDTRNMLCDYLSGAGHSVCAASSREEAIERARNTNLEVLISDLGEQSGIEVMRKVKELKSDITVIAVSSHSSVESALGSLKEGKYEYVSKPFNWSEMEVVLRRVQRAHRKEKEIPNIIDALTSTYNPRYFHEVLSREIDRAEHFRRPFSLVLADIDNFRVYNDTYGYLAGDHILKRIAQLCQQVTRKIDYVFRYGGEEFMLLLPETGKSDTSSLTRRLRQTAMNTKFPQENVFPGGKLTISIGQVTYPDDAVNKEELVAKSIQAMKHAKKMGRNQVCLFDGKSYDFQKSPEEKMTTENKKDSNDSQK
jgi:diguanylate cyclase (GGDEF)-like protein